MVTLTFDLLTSKSNQFTFVASPKRFTRYCVDELRDTRTMHAHRWTAWKQITSSTVV